jgi:GT2 family glycosyltransferase
MDLDLASSPPQIHNQKPDSGHHYTSAFCLLRFAGRPIGVQQVPLNRDGLPPADLELRPAQSPAPYDSSDSAIQPPPTASPFISVIIATRDRPSRLATCLDSLLCQDYASFEVVVVDNAPSSQETADLVSRRYAATGRVRSVREDIVAFTDDDVIVDSRWLSALASHFAASAKIACVTGLILPAELETRAQYWAERHGGFGKGFERKLYDIGAHRSGGRLYPYAAGQFGSGANMAFRTDVLRQIGGFDSALGAGTLARGGDDLAAFFEVIQTGHQLVYAPDAIVWHHHRRDEAGMYRQAFGYGVGLGAYLTKLVLDRPASLLQLAAALPAGLVHLFAPSSPKNKRLADDYPAALVWRERLGILAGMPLYVLSRAGSRRAKDESIAVGSHSFSPAPTARRQIR